jgi:hypothetical protein
MRVLRLVEEQHHRDADGRPIREGRTPPEHLRPDDIEYKPCHYPRSRFQANPMNVSALRQSAERWDEIVDAMALLRTRYAEIRGHYGPDIMDVWRTSQLACALPWYFILARDEVEPAYAAALSKITLGTALLSHRLLHDALVNRVAPTAFTADALYELSETTGTLLGEAEVCAAPAKLIVEFLDVMLAGTPRGLVQLDDDVLRFGAHYTNFKLLLWIHFLARRVLYLDLATRSDLPELAALLDAPCEPPDCFLIEAPAVPRALWFTALAGLAVPMAPDRSDQALVELALAIPQIMTGSDPKATYVALDRNFGELMRAADRGLGGTGDEPDAATRDRLLGISPRAMFDRL